MHGNAMLSNVKMSPPRLHPQATWRGVKDRWNLTCQDNGVLAQSLLSWDSGVLDERHDDDERERQRNRGRRHTWPGRTEWGWRPIRDRAARHPGSCAGGARLEDLRVLDVVAVNGHAAGTAPEARDDPDLVALGEAVGASGSGRLALFVRTALRRVKDGARGGEGG